MSSPKFDLSMLESLSVDTTTRIASLEFDNKPEITDEGIYEAFFSLKEIHQGNHLMVEFQYPTHWTTNQGVVLKTASFELPFGLLKAVVTAVSVLKEVQDDCHCREEPPKADDPCGGSTPEQAGPG